MKDSFYSMIVSALDLPMAIFYLNRKVFVSVGVTIFLGSISGFMALRKMIK